MPRGAAQPEEDGVAGLHGDESAIGVVDCAVHEAGDEAACQHQEIGVVGGDKHGEIAWAWR